MTTQTIATEAELHEAEHIRTHHAHMVAELDRLAGQLHDATGSAEDAAREELATFFDESLLPHAAGEETSIYASAAQLDRGSLLVDALVREHVLIRSMVGRFAAASLPEARVWGLAIADAFRSHQAKEDEVVVPLLLETPGVSLVEAHRGHGAH